MNGQLEIPSPPLRESVRTSRRPARIGGAVETHGLSKRFGTRDVLRDVHLDIVAGESVAIVGRSGTGKSTLLRLLAGIDAPNTGGVWIDGVPAKSADPRVRVMFQESRLLPWKRVLGNVCLGLPRGASERAKTILTEVGLGGREDDWPGKLSGGQQQRVALARALAAQPEVLLLDEPLGALDALTRLEMQTLIERLWRENGFTLVLVTHDVEEAIALADRVLVMQDGAWGAMLSIDLPRPRDRSSAAFVRLRTELLNQILGTDHFEGPIA